MAPPWRCAQRVAAQAAAESAISGTFSRITGIRRADSALLRSLQGPPVQNEQQERYSYQHLFGHQARRQKCGHQQIARDAGLFNVGRVGQQGKHPEEGAQHIFPLRDPGDGLHMQGMQSEGKGDEGGAALPAGRAGQP